MHKIKTFSALAFLSMIFFTVSFAQTLTSQTGSQLCYTTYGCFPIPDQTSWGQTITLDAFKGVLNQAFAYIQANPSTLTSNGFTGGVPVPAPDGTASLNFVNNTWISNSCSNGMSWNLVYNSCSNAAIDYPTCTTCATGSTMTNSQCVCNNGATDSPNCGTCPAGLSLYNNICMCANGATNPTACNICPSNATMLSGQCDCTNGATPQSNCSTCPTGYAMSNGQCMQACNMTNVCGQSVQGVLNNGTCTTPDNSDPNASCITTFTVDTDNVNPNGSVDFSWKLADTPGIGSKCGFVDLTTPTPRPIPGLQNLDPKTDSVRISNIQTTTRFCLICQFYNLVSNAALGDAAVHQWIRVVRIGEE